LKPKFDPTSLANIRTAYDAAFGKCKELDAVFEEQKLHLLEATRHVIVHRAGVIDAEFIARTKNMDVTAKEGDTISLNAQSVSALVNAAIKAGNAILEFVDTKLTADCEHPEAAVEIASTQTAPDHVRDANVEHIGGHP
jgi:hypothetical protein